MIRIDWRRLLIYTHRWLGIVGCLVFLVWFVSGVVMMYARLPRLTGEERLARIERIDLSRIAVPPGPAAAAAGLAPDRLRIGMLDGRPAYRFVEGGVWTTAYADTGAPLEPLDPRKALAVARRFLPEHAATMRYDAHLSTPDQWTIDGGLPRFLPMHRIAMNDPASTVLYVSDRTGEPVMKTTSQGRFWGYAGAVLHWTYFTPFRLQPGLWRWTIIYAALIGCVLCVSGLVAGVWRFSFARRYRIRRDPRRSPYAGFLWWHHYVGLAFGLFSFTWALSGALSLTPWDWTPSTVPTRAQADAARGGQLRLELLSVAAIRRAAARLDIHPAPKELEVLQFRGEPFLLAYRPPAAGPPRVTSLNGGTFHGASLALEHRLVLAGGPGRGAFTRFDAGAMLAAARDAMPHAPIEDSRWLNAYDAYYYDRHGQRPLPVLRVRYADPQSTWLYFDPHRGSVVLKHERRSRINRWLYHGLHSLDFPFLYSSRPAWDITVIVLSIGGIALSATTLVPAWRRLRRRTRIVFWKTGGGNEGPAAGTSQNPTRNATSAERGIPRNHCGSTFE